MSSKYKNEIKVTFNSDDDVLCNDVLNIVLDALKNNGVNLKGLRVCNKIEAIDLVSKGNELLDQLGINVVGVSSNKDVLEAKNFSATLIHNARVDKDDL